MASYNPGTYEGTGRGYGGKLIVNVTVSENRIESVKVTQHKGIPRHCLGPEHDADGALPQADRGIPVAEHPHGRRRGSDVRRHPRCDGGSAQRPPVRPRRTLPRSRLLPPRKAPEYQDEVRTVDVVVCGAGAGGLAAAIEAKLAGADVVIVEKQGITGGATARSGGKLLGAGTKWQKKAGPVRHEGHGL